VSPGAFVKIDGKKLGAKSDFTGPSLPRTHDQPNSFVAVEGVRVPLVKTGPAHIEFQLPLDIPSGTSASVVVWNQGSMSVPVDATVQASTPLIKKVVHAHGAAVSAKHPPKAGEVITVFASGLGAVTTDLPIGTAAPADSTIATDVTPQVLLGDRQLTVQYSGLAPGQIGVYQLNALVPDDLGTDGDYTTCTVVVNGQTATWKSKQE
jgi:uncharacterized protein (TIGR03437 family)